jgi:hypothetical protein
LGETSLIDVIRFGRFVQILADLANKGHSLSRGEASRVWGRLMEPNSPTWGGAATVLMAAAQAIDLRGGPGALGRGSTRVYHAVRDIAAFEKADRPEEREIAALAQKPPG